MRTGSSPSGAEGRRASSESVGVSSWVTVTPGASASGSTPRATSAGGAGGGRGRGRGGPPPRPQFGGGGPPFLFRWFRPKPSNGHEVLAVPAPPGHTSIDAPVHRPI